MTKVIASRPVRRNIISEICNKLLLRALLDKRPSNSKYYAQPAVIFHNDGIGTHMAVYGVFDLEEIDDFLMIFEALGLDPQSGCMIDVGANIGNHTIQFSKHFKSVWCFEPNPRTFELLSINTSVLTNVTAVNRGCGNKAESLVIKENFHNMGGSTVILGGSGDAKAPIEINKLDTWRDEIGAVAAIKIDVEGMELAVLEGAEAVILENTPVIGLEQLEGEFEGKYKETGPIDWLRARGYRIFTIKPRYSGNWVARRLHDVSTAIRGRELRQLVEHDVVCRGSYSMVFAIHESMTCGIVLHGGE